MRWGSPASGRNTSPLTSLPWPTAAVINLSSWVGANGQSFATTYTATKGAITAFSKGLAIDEARHGVRVNIVSPGNIWTPLWKAWSDGEVDPDAAVVAGDKVQPLGRKGTIIEAGKLCLFIAGAWRGAGRGGRGNIRPRPQQCMQPRRPSPPAWTTSSAAAPNLATA